MADASDISVRLRYARERSGLTQAQVKEHTGIGESSLSEFEHGKREPSLSQLAALAAAYQRPVSFFLTAEPIAPEVVRWRRKPPEGAQAIEGHFLQLCEQYHNLETWCGAEAAVDLPSTRRPARPFGRNDADSLARKVRRELGLGSCPALGLLSGLEEQCGIKVFHLDFAPSGTAACTQHSRFGAAVLLNTKSPRWRRNFDLAHELFHLLTWEILQPDEPAAQAWTESDEKLADTFAASLLLPEDAVREAVSSRLRDGKIALPSMFDISRQFDVSVEALIWRIHGLYGGTPANRAHTETMIQKARESARFFEDREHDHPPVRPARFVALAVTALRRGDMSAGRFAEYLGISRQRAMQCVAEEPSGDEALELVAP